MPQTSTLRGANNRAAAQRVLPCDGPASRHTHRLWSGQTLRGHCFFPRGVLLTVALHSTRPRTRLPCLFSSQRHTRPGTASAYALAMSEQPNAIVRTLDDVWASLGRLLNLPSAQQPEPEPPAASTSIPLPGGRQARVRLIEVKGEYDFGPRSSQYKAALGLGGTLVRTMHGAHHNPADASSPASSAAASPRLRRLIDNGSSWNERMPCATPCSTPAALLTALCCQSRAVRSVSPPQPVRRGVQLKIKHDVLTNMGLFEWEGPDWELGYRHSGARRRRVLLASALLPLCAHPCSSTCL